MSGEAKDHIEHLWVIRRNLQGLSVSGGHLAHSAVLVRTTTKKLYVIEFMDDSSVYNYEVKMTVKSTNKEKLFENVSLASAKNGTFDWTKQLHGTAVTKVKWTVGEAAAKMKELTPDYRLLKLDVCHKAQERLRAAMT